MVEHAIDRAYLQLAEKGYDKIYWAIDLHGTCFKANYKNHVYEFINDNVLKTLQLIRSMPENVIILWSSCYPDEEDLIIDFFKHHGVVIDYFNCNPEVENTQTGYFNEKFYFSIGIDDKFGFNPDTDWELVYEVLNEYL